MLDQIIARVGKNDRTNLMPEIQTYPARVFRSLMGLPEEDTERVRALAVLMIAANAIPAAKDHMAELVEYLRQKIDAAERLSTDELKSRKDIISILVATRDGEDRLTKEEIISTLVVLLSAGTDTTSHHLGNTLYFLLTRPDLLEQVKKDRSLIGPALEETLRLVPSGGNYEARRTAKDTELFGVPLKEGTPVITFETTANRDPTRWDNPHEFRLDRPRKQHLGFGFGPHMCIGMHLARMENRMFIDALFDAFPDIRLDESAPMPRIMGAGFQHPTALPVILR
ncbi:MAG: cytochrome P450 [Rhodospirillales bacterium]|nr:cytochrome P450 [Rhodospirillales bacterium]